MTQSSTPTSLHHSLQPTKPEIKQAIDLIKSKYPHSYITIINALHRQILPQKQQQKPGKQLSTCPSKANTNVQISIGQKPSKKKDNKSQISQDRISEISVSPNSSQASNDCRKPPVFQVVQKQKIQRFRPTPTKYEVQEEFLKMVQNKELNISTEVYNRFGRFEQARPFRRVEEQVKGENEENLKRVAQWTAVNNKQYRIYANKVAPRFHSRDQQVKYYEKRLAAKAFAERGYGLGQVKEEYTENGGPVSMEKRRYKTVSTAFISESFRRFEQFLMEDMRKNVRPVTGSEMKALCSILLNARQRFKQREFHCFRKFVKVAFDLGSVSVYEQEALALFQAIHLNLRDRMLEGDGQESEYPEPVRNPRGRLDIYAPKEGGGYQEASSESLDIRLQEIDAFGPSMNTRSLFEQISGDDEPHYFVGAFQDLMHSQVAHVLFDAVLLEVAVAAVHLKGVIGHA